LAVVQKTKTMKKDSAFKLKSGNKPSISKMMGISPVKKAPSKAEIARKLGYSVEAERLLKAVPNKAAYDKLSPQDKIAFDKAAKRAGLPTKKSPASKKMGISPTKKVLDQVKVVGKRAKGTDVTEEYKTKGNKAVRDHIAKGGKVFRNNAGQIVLRKDAPSPVSKKKFRGARSAAAGQTAGQIIRRERLMI
jgi:hypothetical protein